MDTEETAMDWYLSTGLAGENGAEPSAPPEPVTRGSLAEVLAALAQPVPDRVIRERKGGGGTVYRYIPVWTAKRMLDHYTGGRWSKEVQLQGHGAWLSCTVSITVEIDGESVTRTATGQASLDDTYHGDANGPAVCAEAQATSRALAEFGIGRDLYKK